MFTLALVILMMHEPHRMYVRSIGAQQFYEHTLAISERSLQQVSPDEHRASLHAGGPSKGGQLVLQQRQSGE